MTEPTRLSSIETVVLKLLVQHTSLYGLEMVRYSNGRLKRGTIYVTLGRMVEKGYLKSKVSDEVENRGGLPKRLYTPTAFGIKVLNAWDFPSSSKHDPTEPLLI